MFKKAQYILQHLQHHIEMEPALAERLFYGHSLQQAGLYFPVSEQKLHPDKVLWIKEIPILFPLSDSQELFRVEGESVCFSHDLIQSAFYLLSGQQEYEASNSDNMGRFPFQDSIQCRLQITHLPVVNYYFEWIMQGIEAFASLHGYRATRRKALEPFGLFISHDIDRVDKYDYYHTMFHVKRLLGWIPTKDPKRKVLKDLIYCKLQWLKGPKRKNPWWNFSAIRAFEKAHQLPSTFYFLPDHNRKTDSFYRLEEQRIVQLMHDLDAGGCEVGFHAPVAAASQPAVMQSELDRLNKLLKHPAVGNRQHNLTNRYPETQISQQKAGLVYDATMGFAEQEGFRNSYAHPFHPYDFEQEEMLQLWEVPLVVMDATLFKYRKLSYEQARERMLKLAAEVEKFQGVYGLLWHNNYFDEADYPGINAFYEAFVEQLLQQKPQTLTGIQIIEKFKNEN